MLVPKVGAGVLAQIIVLPSEGQVYLVAIEGTTRSAGIWNGYQVRVVRTTVDVWRAMTSEMERRQGRTFSFDTRHQRKALARVSRAVDVRTVPLDATVATQLVEMWSGLLRRSEEARGLLKTADAGRFYKGTTDGVRYHISADGRTAVIDTPSEGTLLYEFAELVDAVAHLTQVPMSSRATAELVLRDNATSVLNRIARQESCLRPYTADELREMNSWLDGIQRNRRK
jgi:hypothetical protein